MSGKKLTLKKFLETAEERFGDRFDYSEVVWPAKPSFDKVRIICPDHGVILMSPRRFFENPHGCGQCGVDIRNEQTFYSKREQKGKTFIEKARAKFGDQYDYSKVEFRSSAEKVMIICPRHGEFRLTPYNFLKKKYGCPGCGSEIGAKVNKERTTYSEGEKVFREKIQERFGKKFSFNEKEFKNFVTPITITCAEHGVFKNIPSQFLQKKYGCPKCAKEKQRESATLGVENFLRRARERFGEKFVYKEEDYKRMADKMLMICPEHGEFRMAPVVHLHSTEGCQQCSIIKKKKFPLWTKKSDFLKEAHKKFGDFFNYKKVKRDDLKGEIIVLCPEHGEMSMTPYSHLKLLSYGCPRCGGSNRIDFVTFIKKARKKFGQRFDYSLFEWKGLREKGTILCKKHGAFQATPAYHLDQLVGCGACGNERLKHNINKAITLEDFIIRAKQVHGDRYDYKKARIKETGQKVKITCPKHGVFEQTVIHHLLKENGCPGCVLDAQRLDKKEILFRCREAHGDQYDYSHIEYKASYVPLKIRCFQHGFFYQTLRNFACNHGCPKCYREIKRKKAQEKFIAEANDKFKNKFSYSSVYYEDPKKKVTIHCPVHGSFEQTPHAHLKSGHGCVICYNETKKNFSRNKSFYSDQS